jgi:hypothetical protein
MKLLRSVCDWIGEQLVGEVPDEDFICEFDCREPQCHRAKWESCPRRLTHAAGELLPAERAAYAIRRAPVSPFPLTPRNLTIAAGVSAVAEQAVMSYVPCKAGR